MKVSSVKKSDEDQKRNLKEKTKSKKTKNPQYKTAGKDQENKTTRFKQKQLK